MSIKCHTRNQPPTTPSCIYMISAVAWLLCTSSLLCGRSHWATVIVTQDQLVHMYIFKLLVITACHDFHQFYSRVATTKLQPRQTFYKYFLCTCQTRMVWQAVMVRMATKNLVKVNPQSQENSCLDKSYLTCTVPDTNVFVSTKGIQ